MKYVASNTIYLALKLNLLIKITYFPIFYLLKLMKILFLLQFDATFIIICKFLSNKRVIFALRGYLKVEIQQKYTSNAIQMSNKSNDFSKSSAHFFVLKIESFSLLILLLHCQGQLFSR